MHRKMIEFTQENELLAKLKHVFLGFKKSIIKIAKNGRNPLGRQKRIRDIRDHITVQ